MNYYKSLPAFLKANGFPLSENPMIAVVPCRGSCAMTNTEFTGDFYMIAFKKLKSGTISYGRTRYDHENGSMLFVKPRQVIEFSNLQLEEAGFNIYFHEDFLNGHPIHEEIKKYGFFDYETNEALHLSPREEQIIWELHDKIEAELNGNMDEYSQDIILTHLDSILKYSQRFYKRQFINRTELSGKTVSKFNKALSNYFEGEILQTKGLPTVNAMASDLNVSSRYLSDMLKQETGKTAMELIHIYLINEAKNRLKSQDQNVSEIAYTLGFENLPYFSRLFKKETGLSPNQFKKQLLN
ncbi:AraC family transcriptional regulator [Mucilaginibacter sp. SMC90]|uniref:helix-turn-helix domain-containing protein n=1 Tax=Mucilaginibacter sp. SMC90 TaxID=2929803 RepID=UPI001FB502D7|nr:AraC family transcriptional regulator [Mucilaginibacter sp. SMC90]UOE49072.1 AraC family transcriptional regulator [Mucilaginibacter sp. SMC90]